MISSNGDRRTRIITAALQVIAQHGVTQVTTRKIAHAADISLATLHYHFESKDDLLCSVLDEVTDTIVAALTTAAQTRSGLRATLASSVATLWSLSEQAPYLPLVRCELILYVSRATAHPSRAVEQQQRYSAALQTLYGDACTAAGERCAIPLDELADLVTSQVDGLALHYAASAPANRLMHISEHLLHAALALVEDASCAGTRAQAARPTRERQSR